MRELSSDEAAIIEGEVAESLGIDEVVMRYKQTASSVHGRRICMYLYYNCFDVSHARSARFFSYNRASSMQATNKIEAMRTEDPKLDESLRRLERNIFARRA